MRNFIKQIAFNEPIQADTVGEPQHITIYISLYFSFQLIAYFSKQPFVALFFNFYPSLNMEFFTWAFNKTAFCVSTLCSSLERYTDQIISWRHNLSLRVCIFPLQLNIIPDAELKIALNPCKDLDIMKYVNIKTISYPLFQNSKPHCVCCCQEFAYCYN